MARKDLAAILLQENLVSARDLERVKRERAAEGRPLWAALLAAQLFTEDQLFFLLARQPVASDVATDDLLDQIEVPAVLRARWSLREALRSGLVPIELDGRRATVVMVDPS